MPTQTPTLAPAEEIAQIDALLLNVAASIIETESILHQDISSIAASEVGAAVTRRTEARNMLSQLQEQQQSLNARKRALHSAIEAQSRADQVATLQQAMAECRADFEALRPVFEKASEEMRSVVARMKSIEINAMAIRNSLHLMGVSEGIPVSFYSRAMMVPVIRITGENDFNFAGAGFVVESVGAGE